MAGTIVSDTIQNGAGASTSTSNVINGSCKAWWNINGVTPYTINASYNVSSVTYISGGQYQVTFTNAMTDANYHFSGNAYYNGTSNQMFVNFSSNTPATASVVTFYVTNTSSAINPTYFTGSIIR